MYSPNLFSFFFFNNTATTEIYTLSLHDALPISSTPLRPSPPPADRRGGRNSATCGSRFTLPWRRCNTDRSEEHTSELQSRPHLVCRLLLEKKKTRINIRRSHMHRELFAKSPRST